MVSTGGLCKEESNWEGSLGFGRKLWILLKGALLEQVLVRRCKSSPRKRGKRARTE